MIGGVGQGGGPAGGGAMNAPAAMELAVQAYGTDRPGTPVVVLHGLLGAARNWTGIARALAQDRPVYCPDLRNHGASPWSDETGFAAMAADVAALLDRLGLASAALVGHSMGGKAVMTLALARPGRVERLMVVDIAPVAYHSRFDGYIAAMRAVPLDRLARRGEAEPFLAEAVPDRAERAFLLQNLSTGPDGRLAWRANLDALAAGLDGITGFDPPPGGRYDGPALFLRGGRSDYVRPDRDGAVIRRLFPRARIDEVAEAGHWVHADRPDAFLAAARAFLAE